MTRPAIEMPPRVGVDSKLLKGVAYHPESKTLEVEFLSSSGVYHYHNVSEAKFQALMAAPSTGSHFLKHVKPHHEFTKR